MDSDLLARLIDTFNAPVVETPYNYCPDCKIPMDIVGLEYQCNGCGRMAIVVESSSKEDISSGRLHISTGSSKGKFYNPIADYSKTQRKALSDQFSKLQADYMDRNRDYIAIPNRVLDSACDLYNTIQKKVMQRDDGTTIIINDSTDDSSAQSKCKKFVRRGTIKDEILAALIYIQCQNEGVSRKKKDIAAFMKLSTQGFSRGEDILRNLKAQGVIDLAMDDEQGSGYIERYLTTLDIDLKYIGFINEIVELSEVNHICMTSQTGSKIVGTIWILIKLLNLKINAKQLESATDNTKKNTFDKFSKCIESSMGTFGHIFRKYELIK
jgi:hypothetical protein